MPSNEILSTAQVAAMLDITRDAVVKLIQQHKLAAGMYGGRYLVDPTEVMRYQRERKPPGWPKPKTPSTNYQAAYRREYRKRQKLLEATSKTNLRDESK